MYFTKLFKSTFFKRPCLRNISIFPSYLPNPFPGSHRGTGCCPQPSCVRVSHAGDNRAISLLHSITISLVGKHQALILKTWGLVCILILPTWNWHASFKTTNTGMFPELSAHLIKCCCHGLLAPWQCRRRRLLSCVQLWHIMKHLLLRQKYCRLIKLRDSLFPYNPK